MKICESTNSNEYDEYDEYARADKPNVEAY